MRTMVYFYLTIAVVLSATDGQIYHIMQVHSRNIDQTLNLLPSNEMSIPGLNSLGQVDGIVPW